MKSRARTSRDPNHAGTALSSQPDRGSRGKSSEGPANLPAMSDQSLELRLSACARAGDIDGLLELVGENPSWEPEEAAYKWLNVASDFGHDEADDMIDSVVEGSLYADDDNYVTGHAHFELAVSYLTGGSGLPVDYDKARKPLKEMVTRHYTDTVEDGGRLLTNARRDLAPEARVVFDTALGRT